MILMNIKVPIVISCIKIKSVQFEAVCQWELGTEMIFFNCPAWYLVWQTMSTHILVTEYTYNLIAGITFGNRRLRDERVDKAGTKLPGHKRWCENAPGLFLVGLSDSLYEFSHYDHSEHNSKFALSIWFFGEDIWKRYCDQVSDNIGRENDDSE